MPGLKLLGAGETMIVCFATEGDGLSPASVYVVADEMTRRGWALNSLQKPECVHICVTLRHAGTIDQFLADLRVSVEVAKENPELGEKGNAAIYGLTSSLPGGPVKEILKIYNDVVLDV
jgi:hypothetical protein